MFFRSLNPSWNFYIKKIPIMDPHSHFNSIWTFISLMILIIHLWCVPITFCFDHYFQQKNPSSIRYFADLIPFIFFIIDIPIALNSSFFYKGNLIQEKLEIFHFYFRKEFFYDIIALIPFFFKFFLKIHCKL